MKLSGKILSLVLLINILAVSIITLFTIDISSKALIESNAKKLQAVSKKSELLLNQYFNSIDEFLLINSKREDIIDFTIKFKHSFHEIEENIGEPTEILQNAYITNNPYPIGEKYKLFELSGNIKIN
ncbi:hypothetical protein [Marinitoga lauensis]|uniref:hypothetical protein n=1 Tax=Marinitoga lauensis TaxID=2201189 RepID=UPI001010543D|nr:hypothetical protein [Marinitoga lauensis]